MSIAIYVDEVTAVLIGGTWHAVRWGKVSTFDLDAYEFMGDGGYLLLGGGREALIPATGFTFTDDETGARISGPLTAIQAVKHG